MSKLTIFIRSYKYKWFKRTKISFTLQLVLNCYKNINTFKAQLVISPGIK